MGKEQGRLKILFSQRVAQKVGLPPTLLAAAAVVWGGASARAALGTKPRPFWDDLRAGSFYSEGLSSCRPTVGRVNDCMTPLSKAPMTCTPLHAFRQSLSVWPLALSALVACTLPPAQTPVAATAAAAVPSTASADFTLNANANANANLSPWPEPASPLESTPIGPVESAGAAANG
jgi:hypothetical protein